MLSTKSCNGVSKDSYSSSSNEILGLLKIRNNVGFQIGENNKDILEDVLEVNIDGKGDTHIPKWMF